MQPRSPPGPLPIGSADSINQSLERISDANATLLSDLFDPVSPRLPS